MSISLAMEDLAAAIGDGHASVIDRPVLAGAIDGLDTVLHAIAPGSRHVFTPQTPK